jgi:hypothetical protein
MAKNGEWDSPRPGVYAIPLRFTAKTKARKNLGAGALRLLQEIDKTLRKV